MKLRIGEFARLAEVTAKALRHYDEIGLLTPAHIDGQSGYRYYTLEQLADIHRIVALKNLGLSLDEVGRTLASPLDNGELRGMLRLKRAELQQRIERDRTHLQRVEYRLSLLEMEGDPPLLDVVIKRAESLRVLALAIEPRHRMAVVVEAIAGAIAEGIIHTTGVAIDVLSSAEDVQEPLSPRSPHHALLEVTTEQPGDVELPGIGTLLLRQEPAMAQAATLVFQAPELEQRHVRFAMLQRWAVSHGYALAGRARILHHVGPLQTLDRGDWVTELQVGVESRVTSVAATSREAER